MIESTVLMYVLPIVAGLALYLLKRQVDAFEKTLAEHTTELQIIRNDYLHKNDFKDFKIELRGMFDELKNDIRGLRQGQ
jgi:hypothetical protein